MQWKPTALQDDIEALEAHGDLVTELRSIGYNADE